MATPASTGGLNHVRSVSRPPRYEAIAIAAVIADRIRPEITAARSRSISTELMNSGTSTIAITRPAPTTKLTNRATSTVRPRNSRRSTSGWLL